METWSAFSFWEIPHFVRDFDRRLLHQPKTSSFSAILKRLTWTFANCGKAVQNIACSKDLIKMAFRRSSNLISKVSLRAAHKLLLPQTITPHVYEGKCPDIPEVIHKTSPIPGPIAPVNQSHPVWQFD